MTDLSELISRAQKGDKEAFGEIYSIFYKRIFRYAYFNVYNQSFAQDVCQETFLKAWKSISSFSDKKGGSFQAFLFKIARNFIIDNSRKKKELSIDPKVEYESKLDLEADFQEEEEKKDIQKALSTLGNIDKQIIILRFFEELSYEEISTILRIRSGALRVRTGRILKKLKVTLAQ